MGAYAALLSLSHTLNQTLILNQYPHLLKKDKLVSLQANVSAILKLLEDYSLKYKGAVNPQESRIIDAAHQAEDVIEARLLSPFRSAFKTDDFNKVLRELSSILEELVSIDKAEPTSLQMLGFSDSASRSAIAPCDVDSTVGLDDDFMAVKKRMYQKSSTFHVIPIFGMGGIGKTTLAMRLYDDSFKMQWFDRHIWIVVSQSYSLRKVLLGILQSMKMPTDKKLTDTELATMVHKELFGRRYLLVADDLWNEAAWDILNRVLPKDTAGSQVLVTTRLQSVATYVRSSSSSQQEVQFLSEEQSWRLLVDRVFGKECCPPQLEETGTEIAKCCHGLPLMIVVVAGLLKEEITEEYWRRTLDMISCSPRSDTLEHCSKVLSLSYDHLPLYLKPCFLYVTAFPKDCEVDADQLVRLWMAEGFVKETGSKCLEEVAEGYLNDLVGRSLLIGFKNRYGDKIRAVKVHDTLREMGMLKAREWRFHYHDSDSWRPEGKERRLTTHNFEIRDTAIRTYLNTGKYAYFGDSFQSNRLLRVLYSPGVEVRFDLRRMLLLRYASIDRYEYHHPELLSKLRNLQSLDISNTSRTYYWKGTRRIRLKIWKMPFLRHVKIARECYLEQPSKSDIVKETNLQTLSEATNLKITPQAIRMLANLRKLYLYYHKEGFWDEPELSLKNLVHLEKLEKLRITDFAHIDWECIWSSELNLPIGLKKLELTSVYIPWDYVNRVGLLPNLEVLKIAHMPNHSEWNPIEGRFLKLKYLGLEDVDLEHWGAERDHFPSLQILLLEEMKHLEEIPDGIGEIDPLKLIELHDCQPSLVASAKQIQAEQLEMCNEQIEVLVYESEQFARKQIDDLKVLALGEEELSDVEDLSDVEELGLGRS